VIKVLSPAKRHPTNRSLADFHRYWAESHGPLFANTKHLRRYVQHLTLPEAYDYAGLPAPTFDGASMFWYDDLDAMRNPSDTPEAVALRQAVGADDRQLFDRIDEWPRHQKRASVVATEHVIIDGETAPSMVKLIFVVTRMPGLTHPEFFKHWLEDHAALAVKVPGVRRYVQNHAILEALTVRPMTHDGWIEMWFDDLESMRQAMVTPEWEAVKADSRTMLVQPSACVIARERIQKWEGRPLTDWGAAGMSEDEIRTRLEKEGYAALAADPEAPRKIKAAALAGALAVWTPEHIVTIDESRIDARPQR
jgi:uncharacterized protein (TIGR02118 family)